MVSSRKRTLDEVSGSASEEPSILHRIRNMWQFANLCQWIYIFGRAMKVDDRLDIDEIETECLKPESLVLQEIGLALLKKLSSFRGLTHDNFDEYTRRQYTSKGPNMKNPFGYEETPAKFSEFDVFTKIRILQQMTIWIMRSPEKVREKMEESKDTEQSQWRIEPMGWDSEDRTYYVLDDNRVYRLTDAPLQLPAPKKKSKAKSRSRGSRASKRRRTSAANDTGDAAEPEAETAEKPDDTPEDDGFGGQKWECLAVTLDEVQELIASFRKTRDENEKILRDQLQEHLLPILEKQEASRRRKAEQRERELLNLAKMANAKRSSRLAGKQERQKEEDQARDEERRRVAEEAAARKAEQQRAKLEKEREIRLMSREKRLQEREARRLRHQSELSNLSEDSKQTGPATDRVSGRRRQAEIEKNRRALEELEQEKEDDDWIFDCICGVYGQIDDGTHSVACERCNVWQHSKCIGVSEDEAEQSDFHFVCDSCRRRERENESKPRTTIKLKVSRPDHEENPTDEVTSPSMNVGTTMSTTEPMDVDPPKSDTPVQTTTSQPNGLPAPTLDNVPSYGQSSSFKSEPAPSHEAPTHSPAKQKSPGPVSQLPHGPIYQSTSDRPSITAPNGTFPVTPGTNTGSFGATATHLPNGSSPSKSLTSPAQDVTSSPVMENSNLLATPALNEGRHADPTTQSSSALPSSEAGQSPTKQSPAVTRPESASSAFSKTSNFPAVFPPAQTLAPSPQQPILTPPTKPAEPPRAQLQQGDSFMGPPGPQG